MYERSPRFHLLGQVECDGRDASGYEHDRNGPLIMFKAISFTSDTRPQIGKTIRHCA